jgi:hypothetical protein
MAIRTSMMVRKTRLPWPFLATDGGGTTSQGLASSGALRPPRRAPRSTSAVSESRGELSGEWGLVERLLIVIERD